MTVFSCISDSCFVAITSFYLFLCVANDCNQVAFELKDRLRSLSASSCEYSSCVSDERTGLVEVAPWIDGLLSFLSDCVH